MKWLRQLLCKHEFEKEEGYASLESGFVFMKRVDGIRVQLLCKKCGYHDSFWKLYK